MSRPTELAELHELIDALHRSVSSLKSKYGDSLPMRRIVNDAERLRNDIERLDIDVQELELGKGMRAGASGEKIAIPDTQYDRDFWGDISDGGVGG
jgi:hypothetical protein